jgi:hypothetical protein
MSADVQPLSWIGCGPFRSSPIRLAVGEDERAAVIAKKRAAVAALPEAEYPCLRDSVDALTECEDVEGYFRSGTQLFLAGVEALQTRLPKRG